MDEDRLERALRAGPLDEPLYALKGSTMEYRTPSRSSRRSGIVSLISTAVIAAAILVSLMVFRSGPTTDTGPGGPDLLAQVRAAGRIRIAVTTGSPQVLVKGIGYEGFDLDVAQAIGRRLGVQVEIDLVDPAKIERGRWDGRWDLAIDSEVSTAHRGALLSVGAGYYARAAAVMVVDGSPIHGLVDLTGQPACIVSGGIAERWLDGTLDLVGGQDRQAPSGVRIVSRQSLADCIGAVRDGTAAAFIADWRFDLPSVPAGLHALGEVSFIGVAATAVDPERAGSARLLAGIDRVVAELHADGTLRSLSELRFGGQDLTTLPQP